MIWMSFKKEAAKFRPIAENTWCQWYDWVANHLPESMQMSENNTKQEVMRLFQSATDNSTPTDYKPETIADGRYVEYNSKKDKTLSMKRYLEKIRPHLRDMSGKCI